MTFLSKWNIPLLLLYHRSIAPSYRVLYSLFFAILILVPVIITLHNTPILKAAIKCLQFLYCKNDLDYFTLPRPNFHDCTELKYIFILQLFLGVGGFLICFSLICLIHVKGEKGLVPCKYVADLCGVSWMCALTLLKKNT